MASATHGASSPTRPRKVSVTLPDSLPSRAPSRPQPGQVNENELSRERRRTRSRVTAVRAERDVPNLLGSPRKTMFRPIPQHPGPNMLTPRAEMDAPDISSILNNPAFGSAPMAGKRRMTRSLTRDIREHFAHDTELPPLDFEEEMLGMFSSHVASLKAQAAEVNAEEEDFSHANKKMKTAQSTTSQALSQSLDNAFVHVMEGNRVDKSVLDNAKVATTATKAQSPMVCSTANGSGTGSGRVAVVKEEPQPLALSPVPQRSPSRLSGNKKTERQKKYFCPHPLCWYETEGFDRKFNLDRHLRSFHKEQWPVSTRPSPPLLLMLGLDPETMVISEDLIQTTYQMLCNTFSNLEDTNKMQTFYEARQTLMSLRLPAGQMNYTMLVQTYRMQQSQFEDLEVLIVGSNKRYAAALEDLNSRFNTIARSSWTAKQQRDYNKEKEGIKKQIYEAREEKVKEFHSKHNYTPKLPRLICSVSTANSKD